MYHFWDFGYWEFEFCQKIVNHFWSSFGVVLKFGMLPNNVTFRERNWCRLQIKHNNASVVAEVIEYMAKHGVGGRGLYINRSGDFLKNTAPTPKLVTRSEQRKELVRGTLLAQELFGQYWLVCTFQSDSFQAFYGKATRIRAAVANTRAIYYSQTRIKMRIAVSQTPLVAHALRNTGPRRPHTCSGFSSWILLKQRHQLQLDEAMQCLVKNARHCRRPGPLGSTREREAHALARCLSWPRKLQSTNMKWTQMKMTPSSLRSRCPKIQLNFERAIWKQRLHVHM